MLLQLVFNAQGVDTINVMMVEAADLVQMYVTGIPTARMPRTRKAVLVSIVYTLHSYTALRMQTSVTAYFKSKQLLLFASNV